MGFVSSCQALTSLKLSLHSWCRVSNNYIETLFPKSLLTSLDLSYITFCGGENGCADPFSAFTMLNSLVIHSCKVKDAQILSISSKTLVNLTIQHATYQSNFPKIELSTPSLCTFTFSGSLDQKICGSGLSSIKQVNIGEPQFSHGPQFSHASVLFSWLLHLVNIESLTTTSTALQIISLVPNLLEVKLPSLCNLKSLEVKLIPPDDGLLLRVEKAMLKKAAASHVKESIKGMKNTSYRPFAGARLRPIAPFSAAKSASAAVPAPAAAPSLHRCFAEKMSTNVDNSDSKIWPEFITKAFIDIMVDEVMKGNMSNGVFHTRTWTLMTTRLNSITKSSYKEEQLKAKMDGLRAMFREFCSLLQNTGFEWNAETNTVSASEEVWQKYLQVHDKSFEFGCNHYKLLEIIFNKNNTTRVLQHSSTQEPPNTDKENVLNDGKLNIGSSSYEHVGKDNSDHDIQEVECMTHGAKQKNQIQKESTSCLMGYDALATMTQVSLAIAERYRGRIVEPTSSHVISNCSLTKCVLVLEKIKEISDDIYGKALEKFKDPDWREMFITMSNDRRRGWLFRL